MALDFVAGCIGGSVGVLVGHPFDTVKVRLQTQTSANRIYSGTFDCFRSIIRKESLFGLYKGITSPLYGLAAINAIVFGVQSHVQRQLPNADSLLSHFAAGAFAGFSQCIICSPMELAKTRMQIQGLGESRRYFRQHKHDYTGPLDCLRKIYRVDGVRGVFRGLGLTIMRETPSFGVYFASFEYFVRLLQPDEYQEVNTKTWVLLTSGGMAGMCSWLCTYPFDVIKTRIQGDRKGKYSGLVDCVIKSYKEEGAIVFTRGLGSTLLRAFPVNAATFTTVTYVLRFRVDQGDEFYDFSQYQALHHPPHASLQLPLVANFPSHP